MAFKLSSSSGVSLENPNAMFMDFSGKKINGLLTHQGKILDAYVATNAKDVALNMPTGSGKTLVGLLIAEWKRRKFRQRVVYVCPTKQLVHQVVEEADKKYGMGKSVHAFVGKQKDYDPQAKSKFMNAECIAVTTYGGLFNANTFLSDPNLIIFDDAHASENNLANFWTLEIDKDFEPDLFNALVGVFSQILSALDIRKLTGAGEATWDSKWTDILPWPKISDVLPQLHSILDEHTAETDLKYTWQNIRSKISACQWYLGSGKVIVRPVIPPTMRYAPFAAAEQRIYMSATLGEGGDLERLLGVKKVTRLELPSEFVSQGVGRRFFIFPGRALEVSEQDKLQNDALQMTRRGVVLTPSFKAAKATIDSIKNLKIPCFSASDLEKSKSAFVESEEAIAVLANRYDGIDFPGKQSELLIMRNLPGATGLQEQFLLSRMSARLLLQDRIRTRVVQAVGRCTRSATDFSAVIVLGEDLLTYLSKKETRAQLHPELQAEIEFGLEQSTTASDMLENLQIFLDQGEAWEGAENEILAKRKKTSKQDLAGLKQLSEVVSDEVKYQYALWDEKPELALQAARSVSGGLRDSSLEGYRAYWYYLSGVAASQASKFQPTLGDTASDMFLAASKLTSGLPWMREIAARDIPLSKVEKSNSACASLFPRLEAKLGELGTLHDHKYSKYEKEILSGLASDDAKTFEAAHLNLGLILGYDAGKDKSDGSPDPWWQVDDTLCFVFEDHTDRDELGGKLSVTKARQAASHEKWIRKHLNLPKDCEVVVVLITSTSKPANGAGVHLDDVCIWNLDHFREWAIKAIQTVRQVRVTFPGEGDLEWRAKVAAAYSANKISPTELRDSLFELKGKEEF